VLMWRPHGRTHSGRAGCDSARGGSALATKSWPVRQKPCSGSG
jgi:hypothetical protein